MESMHEGMSSSDAVEGSLIEIEKTETSEAVLALASVGSSLSTLAASMQSAIVSMSNAEHASLTQINTDDMKATFDALNSLDAVEGEKRNGTMSRQQAFGGLFKKDW